MSLGLVLGGGGVAGVAWEAGVLAGLAEAGVRPAGPGGARRIVGTSAGAIVGLALGSGAAPDELLRAVRSAAAPEAPASGEGSADAGRYRAFIDGLLPRRNWPGGVDLRVTAADADSGAVQVWDADSGVDVVDAIAASCAVPGRYPAVVIGGRRCIDGGSVSATHADLAAGCSEVLVIAPVARAAAGPGLDAEMARLGTGVRSAVIVPDEASLAAIGADPMASATRLPAADAGRAQGRAEAMRVGIMLSL